MWLKGGWQNRVRNRETEFYFSEDNKEGWIKLVDNLSRVEIWNIWWKVWSEEGLWNGFETWSVRDIEMIKTPEGGWQEMN